MSTLQRGDVVLTQFPFTDLSSSTLRPALIVSDGRLGDDVVLVAISSVRREDRISTDLAIDGDHGEFPVTGLRMASVIRVHKLATVERSVIRRRLGRVGSSIQAEVDQLLHQVLALP